LDGTDPTIGSSTAGSEYVQPRIAWRRSSDAKRLEVLKQIVPSGQRFEWGKLDKPKP